MLTRNAAPLLCLALLSLARVPPAAAQEPSPSAPAPRPSPAAPDSPRRSLERYLDLAREGRFEEAARFLQLPEGADGPLLARRLKAVLDQHLWIDLDRVSPLSAGDPGDDLPDGTDLLGTLPGSGGTPEPVRLVRVGTGEEAHWAFSRATVERIDTWYQALGSRWAYEYLPSWLLRPGPRELLWWQWLALPVVVFLAWTVGFALGRVTRSVLGRVTARTGAQWDDILLERLSIPLALVWTVVLLYLAMPSLALHGPAADFVRHLLRVTLLVAIFWALMRVVDIAARRIGAGAWAVSYGASRSLIPLGSRVAKIAVIFMGGIAVLSEFGYPVASLLAGLGIGGLAVALAAQKTFENLFGAFALGVDQPFREGDFVLINDFVGTVEQIGLRSTRIRTLDRTVVTIPNGQLAEMRLESFTARDRLRLACIVGLVYETTAEQMREVLAGLERALRAHPKIWPDAVVVKFKEFGASSLDIEIMAWFQTSDWGEFQGIRQEVLISFMEVVEKAGSSFAFPTRTVHLVGGGAPPPEATPVARAAEA